MKLMHKSIQKPSKKQLKINTNNDTGKASKKSLKIPPTLRFRGPILEPFVRRFRSFCCFLVICFSEPLGGTPLDRLWPPLVHPWFDFVDLLEDFGSKFALNFKDSRATNVTNHTFKKTSKDSNKPH
jgi:hypothetical protein